MRRRGVLGVEKPIHGNGHMVGFGESRRGIGGLADSSRRHSGLIPTRALLLGGALRGCWVAAPPPPPFYPQLFKRRYPTDCRLFSRELENLKKNLLT